VTAGSDIGLLGRGDDGWRIWVTEDENRRATVPYNMEKNEETIVVGMQLDFTADKKISKPLYPDEDPVECEALPILWVLNTSGQLAGWTMMYVPGIKAGERPVSMMSLTEQDQYWQTVREARLKNVLTSEELEDKATWEKEWKKAFSAEASAIASESKTDTTPTSKSVTATPEKQTPAISRPSQPNTNTTQPSQPAFGQPSQLGANTSPFGQTKPPFGQPSQLGAASPAFGQPSQLGASKPAAFGQTGQLGGALPGQSGLYSSFAPGLNANRTGHVFGQSSGLGSFGSSTGSGFAKYTSSQSTGGFLSGSNASTESFLSGANSGGSFLSAGQGGSGSFLQGAHSSGSGSFLQGTQSSGSGSFLQGGSANSLAKGGTQGFEKFITPGQGFGTAAPSSFSDGGFLAPKSSPLGRTSKASPFGITQKPSPSLSERTQSLNKPESRSQSYDLLEDDSEETDEESGLSESETEDENTEVRVDPLSFGDAGFDLNLSKDTERPRPLSEEQRPVEEPQIGIGEKTPAPIESSTSSLSPSDDFVKVAIPSTPSPTLEKSDITSRQTRETAPVPSSPPTDRGTKQSEPAIAPLPKELPAHLKITPPRSDKAIISPDPIVPAQSQKSFFPPQAVPQQPQVEKAPLPPDPVIPQPRAINPQLVQQITTPQKTPLPTESPRQTPSPSSRKVELRQFVPIAGSTRISSKLNNSSNLSDAFRLVIEQVSKELERVSPSKTLLTVAI